MIRDQQMRLTEQREQRRAQYRDLRQQKQLQHIQHNSIITPGGKEEQLRRDKWVLTARNAPQPEPESENDQHYQSDVLIAHLVCVLVQTYLRASGAGPKALKQIKQHLQTMNLLTSARHFILLDNDALHKKVFRETVLPLLATDPPAHQPNPHVDSLLRLLAGDLAPLNL